MNEVKIKLVRNGYIVTDRDGDERVYLTLDDVVEYLLLAFEGLSKVFDGELWGNVTIFRHKRHLTPHAADPSQSISEEDNDDLENMPLDPDKGG